MEQPCERMRMPGHWFDELASGGGSPEAVGFLVSAERNRRLILLAEVLDRVEEHSGALAGPDSVAAAWQLISEAARHRPPAVEELLCSPQTGSWAAHLLRRLHGSAGGPPLWVDVGHLHAVCLAACALAGLDADVTVPVRDGAVVLPTLGLARLEKPGSGIEYDTATARLRGAELTLAQTTGRAVTVTPLSERETADWFPLRRLGPTTWLDDVDPYRDLAEPVPPERLEDAEVEVWRQLFKEAATIPRPGPSGPGRLRGTDIRRIVPWAGTSGEPRSGVVSATTGDAFGSMVVSRPATGLALAEAMVHEFQHSKLSALLHLFPLLDDDRAEIHYAPWRPDPRHLTGLLHGAYAFVGVAGFWRDRMAEPSVADRDVAAFQFALLRVQTGRVVRTLRASDRLTPTGRRLVDGLAGTLRGWRREPVPPTIAARAAAAAISHAVEWRLRNQTRLATEPAGSGTPPVDRPVSPDVWADDRLRLYREPPTRPVTPDELLAAGLPSAAEHGYAATLRATPDDPHALAGWLLATATLHPHRRRLLRRPERLSAALASTGTTPGTPAMATLADRLCAA
ncbi:HEXXH motif domain-containing protein [Streptomyces millisiae]|uniref:HEXXH motif domain-containing protein n=1 Tax=Streptomyces millisiae TaxID=3075542 RepID=A0ABU2LVU5_9ACTN|nr:HEXXH motif domain-containing protein [Streptomyces sp. DSM 44918]MDT0321699.1 HEXXH motif domain-containing protein [Streptomyces sp. DSM 44918]